MSSLAYGLLKIFLFNLQVIWDLYAMFMLFTYHLMLSQSGNLLCMISAPICFLRLVLRPNREPVFMEYPTLPLVISFSMMCLIVMYTLSYSLAYLFLIYLHLCICYLQVLQKVMQKASSVVSVSSIWKSTFVFKCLGPLSLV